MDIAITVTAFIFLVLCAAFFLYLICVDIYAFFNKKT